MYFEEIVFRIADIFLAGFNTRLPANEWAGYQCRDFNCEETLKKERTKQMAEVEDSQENFKICMQGNCNTCPSYSKQPGEGLFCARGPSKVAIEKRGCNCPECQVWMDNGLSSMYYCNKTNK